MKINIMNIVIKTIILAGSNAKLANVLNVKPSAISIWKKRGYFPLKYAKHINAEYPEISINSLIEAYENRQSPE